MKQAAPLKKVYAEGSLMITGSNGLIDGLKVKAVKVLCDERGRLGEIIRNDDELFVKFGQVYFTTTYPGVVKAWHWHKKQFDSFYVAKGTIKVGLYDNREDSKTKGCVNQIYMSEHSPAVLRIPPGICHGWMCVSQDEAYIINTPSEVYDYSQPDEFRIHPHDNDIPYDWTRKDG